MLAANSLVLFVLVSAYRIFWLILCYFINFFYHLFNLFFDICFFLQFLGIFYLIILDNFGYFSIGIVYEKLYLLVHLRVKITLNSVFILLIEIHLIDVIIRLLIL